jgi:hypothetical protein
MSLRIFVPRLTLGALASLPHAARAADPQAALEEVTNAATKFATPPLDVPATVRIARQ